MKRSTILAKLTTVTFLSAAVASAYADISCPSVDTLNKVITQENGIPDAFTDQGLTYGNANATPTRGAKALSFNGVGIPTTSGNPRNSNIVCSYNFQYDMPNAPITAYVVANVRDKYKGVAGDWNIVPAKSSCISNSATGCMFTKEN